MTRLSGVLAVLIGAGFLICGLEVGDVSPGEITIIKVNGNGRIEEIRTVSFANGVSGGGEKLMYAFKADDEVRSAEAWPAWDIGWCPYIFKTRGKFLGKGNCLVCHKKDRTRR